MLQYAQQKVIIDFQSKNIHYDHFKQNEIKMYNLSTTKLAYEDVAARLLVISPILATASLSQNSSIMFTDVHKNLTELNEVCNNLIGLIEDELTPKYCNIKMPAPSLLPKIRNIDELTQERDRLFLAVEEFNQLYLYLIDARLSVDGNWSRKWLVTIN